LMRACIKAALAGGSDSPKCGSEIFSLNTAGLASAVVIGFDLEAT
jgi:hypothetical protein